MARKRFRAEGVVNLLRQAEVLRGQGMSMAEAIRQLGIGEVTLLRGFRPAAEPRTGWRSRI